MTLPYDKIGKAVAMLEGTSDTEKLAAVGAMERLLNSSGRTFVDLGDAIGRLQPPRALNGMRPPSSSMRKATESYCSQSVSARDKAFWLCNYAPNLLTDREFEFVADMLGRLARSHYRPSEKQTAWLEAIFVKTKREVA